MTPFIGYTCSLWEDLWAGKVPKLVFPELFSFAKQKNISLRNAAEISSLKTLFHLPLSELAFQPGFFYRNFRTEPPPTGSSKPDRFDRLPEKTGQIQISNQKWQFNRFPPVSRPVRPVNRSGLSGNRPNSIFFLFWFKFKCPQSILNECLYKMF